MRGRGKLGGKTTSKTLARPNPVKIQAPRFPRSKAKKMWEDMHLALDTRRRTSVEQALAKNLMELKTFQTNNFSRWDQMINQIIYLKDKEAKKQLIEEIERRITELPNLANNLTNFETKFEDMQKTLQLLLESLNGLTIDPSQDPHLAKAWVEQAFEGILEPDELELFEDFDYQLDDFARQASKLLGFTYMGGLDWQRGAQNGVFGLFSRGGIRVEDELFRAYDEAVELMNEVERHCSGDQNKLDIYKRTLKAKKALLGSDLQDTLKNAGFDERTAVRDAVNQTINNLYDKHDMLTLGAFLDEAANHLKTSNHSYWTDWDQLKPTAKELQTYQELLDAGLLIKDTTKDKTPLSTEQVARKLSLISEQVNDEALKHLCTFYRGRDRHFEVAALHEVPERYDLSDKDIKALEFNKQGFNGKMAQSLTDAKRRWRRMFMAPETFWGARESIWQNENKQVNLNASKASTDMTLRFAQFAKPNVITAWHNEYKQQGFDYQIYYGKESLTYRKKRDTAEKLDVAKCPPVIEMSREVIGEYNRSHVLTLSCEIPKMTTEQWNLLDDAQKNEHLEKHFNFKLPKDKLKAERHEGEHRDRWRDNWVAEANIIPTEKKKYSQQMQKDPIVKVIGSKSCTHANGTFDLNPSRDAVFLNCPNCLGTRLAVIPRHQLPKEHPHALKPTEQKKYLAKENIYRRLNALTPAKTFADLKKIDPIIEPNPQNYSIADWPSAVKNIGKKAANPFNRPR